MGEEEPRRKRPRAESASKPHGLGEWVFMARKACTPPLPTLKPNPSRSFLSAGRGDYPKEISLKGGSMNRNQTHETYELLGDRTDILQGSPLN